MKKATLLLVLGLLLTSVGSAPEQVDTFKSGEWFKFRVHYGVFNACYATLQVNETTLNGKEVFHVKGHGESAGMLDWFFKVDDTYESYFMKDKVKPVRFIRKINEGGHKKDIQIDFDYKTKKALVHNKKYDKKQDVTIPKNAQDMVSAFYYMRDEVDAATIQPGDEFILPMFMDEDTHQFKLKFLKREIIDTEFGKMRALKFRPYVMSGRVFKEEESLTVWVSDDKNKMPLRIKADIAVGSIKADLEAFKGLKHPFTIVVD